MSEPSTESYGDLDDHHEHDDSTPPTATDEDHQHQHDSDDTTTSTTRNHHHPTRRRKYLYIIASLPLLISTLALFGVSFSTRGTSSESNNSLYGSNVHNSSGATSALAETTLVATVPTRFVTTPKPSPTTQVSSTDTTTSTKYLRPTSSPSVSISPTISPSLSTSPTISPSLSTSPTISPSASMSPSSLFDSTCKITGETCTDDKMCCDRRCVPNEEGSGGADAGGGDANAAGGGPGGEAGKLDEKEKEKVEAGEKEKEEPKGRRRMAMERVCM